MLIRRKPTSVCAVVISDGDWHSDIQTRILAVTRKTDATQFALPGGKIEPGETPEQAVLRELKEETGVEGFRPEFLYTMNSVSGSGYCECFFIPNWVCIGGLKSIEPVNPQWVLPDKVLEGPYWIYNTKVLGILREKHLI